MASESRHRSPQHPRPLRASPRASDHGPIKESQVQLTPWVMVDAPQPAQPKQSHSRWIYRSGEGSREGAFGGFNDKSKEESEEDAREKNRVDNKKNTKAESRETDRENYRENDTDNDIEFEMENDTENDIKVEMENIQEKTKENSKKDSAEEKSPEKPQDDPPDAKFDFTAADKTSYLEYDESAHPSEATFQKLEKFSPASHKPSDMSVSSLSSDASESEIPQSELPHQPLFDNFPSPQSRSELPLDSESESLSESKAEFKTESKTEIKTEFKIKSKAEFTAESKLESKIDPDLEPISPPTHSPITPPIFTDRTHFAEWNRTLGENSPLKSTFSETLAAWTHDSAQLVDQQRHQVDNYIQDLKHGESLRQFQLENFYRQGYAKMSTYLKNNDVDAYLSRHQNNPRFDALDKFLELPTHAHPLAEALTLSQ